MHYRIIKDFPKRGVNFIDITPVLLDKKEFNKIINEMSTIAKMHNATKIAGIESRGFILGAAVAHHLNLPFVPIRKEGKLPYKTKQWDYEKEYGQDMLQIHIDAITKKDKVVIIDDILATGGTINAAWNLVNLYTEKNPLNIVLINLKNIPTPKDTLKKTIILEEVTT